MFASPSSTTATATATALAPALRHRRRTSVALALATAALSAACADTASAAAPVPCSSVSGSARYNCQFYPAAGAPVQAADGRVVGTLHKGTNWVLCQRVGGSVRSGSYYNNNWAWTLADNDQYGWVNAVYASGGDDDGRFNNVPDCGNAHGNPPAGGAAPAPPVGAPPVPGAPPAAWGNGPVNAPAWRPAKRRHNSITCGLRAIPANLPPQSVSRGFTPRAQAIVNVIRGPLFGWRNIGGGATGARTGHISNSFHYCGRAIDSFAPGVRAGTRATGAGLTASWRLANWAAHNAAALNVAEVIFYDRIWTANGGGWSRYTNPGGSGNTLAHRDHVHISVY